MLRWTSVKTISQPRMRRAALWAGSASLFCLAQPAYAQCVADSTGKTVTCSGTSTTYTNTASGVTLNAASGSTVTGPVILGPQATVTNAGTITGIAGTGTVQVGNNSTVTNNGTLTSPGSTTGSAAVTAGDYSTVTNNGSLTAVTGLPVATFGKGGTFINNTAATVAVSGNVAYGVNLGTDVATFKNYNLTYGFTGVVTSSGNTNFYNSGLFTGALVQTATAGAVTIVNDTGGTYSGYIVTGDKTTLTNNGTMVLSSISQLGTLLTAGTTFTNNGALTIGTSTAPNELLVNGAFTQGSAGTLNLFLAAPGSTTPAAISSYGLVYASGGTATLGGTLNLSASAGFYPTGSTYNVIVADKGISGNFSSVTGGALTFISFVPNGIVTLSSGAQAYQLVVQRTNTYGAVLTANGATANQIAVANAFQPLVATATATPAGSVASLIGELDFLTVDQAKTFFDSMSPAGYLGYADAIRDQTNNFHRAIGLRMRDQNSDHPEQGFWVQGGYRFSGQLTTGQRTRQSGPAIQGGYDFSGPNFVLGASAGYSYDSLRYGGGNLTGHSSATQLGLYGGVRVGPLTADGIVSYQFGSIGTTRTITIGSTTGTATASPSSHVLSATGTIGPNIKLGGFSLLPFGGVQYTTGSIKEFTEGNISVANLTVGKLKADRTDLLAGVTLTPNQGTMRPYVKATYRSLMGSAPGSTVSAYLNGDTTTSFTVNGLSAAKTEWDVDAGLNIVIEDQGGFFFGYQGTYRDDLRVHSVAAGLRIEFW